VNPQRLGFFSKYGSPIAVVAALALVVALAPTKTPEEVNEFLSADDGATSAAADGETAVGDTGAAAVDPATGEVVAVAGTGGTTGATVAGVSVARPGATGGTTAGRTTGSTPTGGGTTGGGGGGGAAVPPNAVAGTATPGADCTRTQILKTDVWGCKPAFSGSNGGATYKKGVTGDKIQAVFYVGQTGAVLAEEPNTSSTVVCGIQQPTPEDFDRTIEVYEEFFNRHWQLYGRKLDIKVFRAQALSTDSAATRSEAVKVDQEIKPFLLINSFANEFVDETSRRGIVNFGGVGLSTQFLKSHAPFVFQLGQDTDMQNAMLAEYIAKRVDPYPTSITGDPATQGSNLVPPRGVQRKYGVLYPGDAAQQLTGMGDDMLARLQAKGIPASRMKKYAYQSDATTWPTQAPNLVAQMKADGITSMLIMVNPAFISFFTPAATAQGWFPEYIVTDFVLQGTSAIPRAVAQNPVNGQPTYSQWKRAFGISFNAAPPDVQSRCNGSRWERWGYEAYRSVDPDGEPDSGFIIPFVGLLHAVQALENAGPVLDPGTYRDGVFKIKATPPGGKTDDRRGYGPGDYSGSEDIVEIWWNPAKNTRGPGNVPGEYEYANDGMRYALGQIPAGETQAFQPCSLQPGGCGGDLPKWLR
jgi:hypothetical protein